MRTSTEACYPMQFDWLILPCMSSQRRVAGAVHNSRCARPSASRIQFARAPLASPFSSEKYDSVLAPNPIQGCCYSEESSSVFSENMMSCFGCSTVQFVGAPATTAATQPTPKCERRRQQHISPQMKVTARIGQCSACVHFSFSVLFEDFIAYNGSDSFVKKVVELRCSSF